MLATHTIDPEDPASSAGQALYTITAGGFSATADAFARDEQSEGLWFVSMVGSQTALKAIWASLLKQPPDVAHIIRGADGMGPQRRLPAVRHSPRDHRHLDDQDRPPAGVRRAGTRWCTPRPPSSATRRTSFLLLAQSEEEAPALHHRFLDKRSPLPLHGSWAGWLWERGIKEEEIVPLQSVGVFGYRCSLKAKKLREELSDAVASGRLTLPREASDG